MMLAMAFLMEWMVVVVIPKGEECKQLVSKNNTVLHRDQQRKSQSAGSINRANK